MFIKREIIGGIVTLVFYIGILSTLLSFATGTTVESVKYSDINHNPNTISSAVDSDNPYGYEH